MYCKYSSGFSSDIFFTSKTIVENEDKMTVFVKHFENLFVLIFCQYNEILVHIYLYIKKTEIWIFIHHTFTHCEIWNRYSCTAENKQKGAGFGCFRIAQTVYTSNAKGMGSIPRKHELIKCMQCINYKKCMNAI